jgi:hypothetical protein
MTILMILVILTILMILINIFAMFSSPLPFAVLAEGGVFILNAPVSRRAL